MNDRVPGGALAEPNGCWVCGIGRREHMQRWAPSGWHSWSRPTDRMILARMRARRAARA